MYGPGDTQKNVSVQLLELGEKDGLLEDKQVKQFVMDLSNPRQGAKLGRYPRTTVTITDQPGEWTRGRRPACRRRRPSRITDHKGFSSFFPCYFIAEPSVITFKKANQSFTTSDPMYNIPVVRLRNQDSPATVNWRTKKQSGSLTFGPGENEKNIVIVPKPYAGPIQPDTFQVELFDPSSNASIGERKTTTVNITDGGKTLKLTP